MKMTAKLTDKLTDWTVFACLGKIDQFLGMMERCFSIVQKSKLVRWA